MIVSWNWLKQYVALEMPLAELEQRLMMAGLNHEGTDAELIDDIAIDLEVTSNRPDCLGHLGVAREIAVLYDLPLKFPGARPQATGSPIDKFAKVSIDAPHLCPRYTARVIRGIQVGPSPDWLSQRLLTLANAFKPKAKWATGSINNIVDITNYVLMECGQPLHAFDLKKLAGPEIIVRAAHKGEQIEAIDHNRYELTKRMCVIADTKRPVAIAGVMGGAETEVDQSTTDLLIESADFDPVSVRTTARQLKLHSDSSFRFERSVDPEAIDWASRRCCELILKIAGGELCEGVIDVGQETPVREPIILRLSQLKRILGIEVGADRARNILTALGGELKKADEQSIEIVPPSWRRDLTREIDLVEEVARIHGYEKIPEDVPVAMVPSSRSDHDRVMSKTRHLLTSLGFSEAMTASTVSQSWSEAFSPWSECPALICTPAMLRGADQLRRSLIPSLLGSRQVNESLANKRIEFFELAKVYLPKPGSLPDEHVMLSVTSGSGFAHLKGVAEALLRTLNPSLKLETADFQHDLLDPSCSAKLMIGGETVGYLGEVNATGLRQFQLRNPATVMELNTGLLVKKAQLIPQYVALAPYPSIDRDLNLVVTHKVRWSDLANTITKAGGELLTRLDYLDTYENAKDSQLGSDKKSVHLSFVLQSTEGTLTGEQADKISDQIIAACAKEFGAEIRS